MFLGTAFAYKSPRFLLTASHIIPDELGMLSITFPYLDKVLIPTKLARHEWADVAALACEPKHVNNREFSEIENFLSITHGLALAQDFLTYGYPEDVLLHKRPSPTPRLFKGYFQRLFRHSSHLGYRYQAIELSTQCPRGLSGSPIMLYGNATCVAGVVTEDLEVATEHHIEEAEDEKMSEYRKVINYGVAAELSGLDEWITDHLSEVES